MKRLLTALLNRQNILSTITIIIGILSIFGIPQASLGWTFEQLVLGLLSVIILQVLVANIGYLEHVYDLIRELVARIKDPGIDDLVASHNDRFRLDDYLDEAKDVVIWDIAPEPIVMNRFNLIVKMMDRGCNFCFIVSDPISQYIGLLDLHMKIYTGHDIQARYIDTVIKRIAQLPRSAQSKRTGTVTLRTYNGAFFHSGIKIITRNKIDNVIWIEYYAYGKTVSERRGLLVAESTSPATYQFYSDSLDNLLAGSALIDLKGVVPISS